MRRIFATVGFSSFFITIFAVRLGQTFALALSITALIAFVLCLTEMLKIITWFIVKRIKK